MRIIAVLAVAVAVAMAGCITTSWVDLAPATARFHDTVTITTTTTTLQLDESDSDATRVWGLDHGHAVVIHRDDIVSAKYRAVHASTASVVLVCLLGALLVLAATAGSGFGGR